MKLYILMITGFFAATTSIHTAQRITPPKPTQRYDEYHQLVTHNSTSTTQKRLAGVIPNPVADQNNGIDQQLRDGIRAFKIPVHLKDEEPWVTHTVDQYAFEKFLRENVKWDFLVNQVNSAIGSNLWKIDATNQSLESVLIILRDFLAKNPTAVITLFLNVFVHSTKLDLIFDVVKKTGINMFLHIQNVDAPWPTFDDLIKDNKRLILFADSRVKGLMFTKDYVLQNEYTFKDLKELQNDLLQKDYMQPKIQGFRNKKTMLTIENHFITPSLAGNEADAQQANNYPVVKSHLERFKKSTGNYPQFLFVDFYDKNFSDLVRAINEIN